MKLIMELHWQVLHDQARQDNDIGSLQGVELLVLCSIGKGIKSIFLCRYVVI